MSEPGSITGYIRAIQEGDLAAATPLWHRYYGRLVGLARKGLRDVPRRALDEDDVVVSAFDSFCRGAEHGRFPDLHDRDDLWQILVMLTARKAANEVKHELRQRRGAGRVRGDSAFMNSAISWTGDIGIDQVAGSEPTPEFAAQVAQQCQGLLERLEEPSLIEIAIAKLEGYRNDEIAQRLAVHTRTVERKLRIIREIWSGPS